jgi:tight adherence protein B
MTAPVACCTAAFCVATLAWMLTGRHGPKQARLLLATGADCERGSRGSGPARPWGDAVRAVVPGRVVERLGSRFARRRSAFLTGRLARLGSRAGRAWLCLPAGVALGLLGESVIPALGGVLAVPLAARWDRARRTRTAAERRESAVIELCAGVAGELRGGRMPAGALLAAGVAKWGREGGALLAAARFGGDIPAVLHRAAQLPGADGLRGAAACWQVSADGGAGLADGMDRVADALRAERDQRADLRAQLTGPRSTAAVLALLPVFGLLLGTGMGAGPLQVLLHSPVGLGCLTAGALLEWAGLAWVARLVRGAEEVS